LKFWLEFGRSGLNRSGLNRSGLNRICHRAQVEQTFEEQETNLTFDPDGTA
jgi:hypothetical protein